jgi:enoyl-CoA hydratase
MPIQHETSGPVATLSLNGADETNRLTPAMLIELDQLLHRFDADASVRVIPTARSTSASGRARADAIIGQFFNPRSQAAASEVTAWETLFARRTVKPVVAAIRGDCWGSALAIVGLHADIRVAAPSARFGFPEISRGIGAADPVFSRLVDQLPRTTLFWMVETGLTIDAAAAHACHLVNEVVDDARLEQRAIEIAEMIAAVPPAIVQAEKLGLVHLEHAQDADAVVLSRVLATVAQQTR